MQNSGSTRSSRSRSCVAKKFLQVTQRPSVNTADTSSSSVKSRRSCVSAYGSKVNAPRSAESGFGRSAKQEYKRPRSPGGRSAAEKAYPAANRCRRYRNSQPFYMLPYCERFLIPCRIRRYDGNTACAFVRNISKHQQPKRGLDKLHTERVQSTPITP